MTLAIASSTFTSGPKDDLIAPDIYSLDPKKIISSIPIKSSDIKDLFSSISMKNGEFDIMGSLGKLSKTELGSQVTDAVKELGANARELGEGITGQATTLLDSVAPSAKALSCTIGEYASSVSWKDAKAGLQIGMAVASMKGSGVGDVVKVFNTAASTSVFSSVVQKASEIGMGGVFTTLKSAMDDNGVLSRVVKASVPFLLKQTDVRLLDQITQGGLGKVINAVSPGFTKTFSSYYKPTSRGISNITTFNGMLNSFDKISSDWDKVSQGGDFINSVVSLFGSSSAFKSVLYSGIRYGIDYSQTSSADLTKNQRLEAMANATLYRESTVSDQISKYFPNIAMIGSYTQRSIKDQNIDLKLLDRSVRAFIS